VTSPDASALRTHWVGGVELAALAAADLQQAVVGKTESDSNQESEDATKNPFNRSRLTKHRQRSTHAHNSTSSYPAFTNRSDAEFMQ
jgi:hypothetical protein